MTFEELDRVPKLGPLYRAAALGRLRRRQDVSGGSEVPLGAVEYVLHDVPIDLDRLAVYNRVCGFPLTDLLPPTYPHVMAFPLALTLMTRADFPLPPLGLVHIANRIEIGGPLRADDRFALRVRASDLRPHERGRQVDIIAEAYTGGTCVWQSRSTYLRKERRKPRDGRTPNAGRPGADDETSVVPTRKSDETVVISRHARDETVIIPTRGADETVIVPRHTPDETAIIPASRPDETVIIPTRGADETVIVPQHRPDETVIVPRHSHDETAIIPRYVTDETPAVSSRISAVEQLNFDDLSAAEANALWRVGPDVARRYAAASGDRNPIHTSRIVARVFGFRRRIAHGMWTMARSVAALEGRLPETLTIEVRFQRPLPLPAVAGFTARHRDGTWQLAVRDMKSREPNLIGLVTPMGTDPPGAPGIQR